MIYKNPEGVAHKVLADEWQRNPGNKPKPNDRIPYAYIKLKDTDLYDYNNLYKMVLIKVNQNQKRCYRVIVLNIPTYNTKRVKIRLWILYF